MVIASPILSDQAVISTSESPSGLPGSNLQNMAIKQVWRSLDSMNAWIIAQMPEGGFDLIAVLGHNGSSQCSARVRAADTESNLTASPSYDSGYLPARSHQVGYALPDEVGAMPANHFIHILAAPQSYEFWRIDFNDPNTEYFDAGRLYISKIFQPATNMSYNLQEGIVDPSRVSVTVSGRVSSKKNPKRRYIDLNLDFATEAEMREDSFDIEYSQGVTGDVLIIPDPDAGAYLQKRTIYGRLTALAPTISAAFRIFQKNYRIEEITA